MTIGPLTLSPPQKLQFFVPGTNTPAVGAKIFTYAAGTTTKQATYSNVNQTPNTNPIILDANGECVMFLDSTLSYDITYSPSTDSDPPTNPYWTVKSDGYATMTSGFAPINSPVFTGTPTAPTPTSGDSSTNIATTQFVQNAIVTDLNNSATSVPTAAPGTLTSQIASTKFVGIEIAKSWNMQVFSAGGIFTVPGTSPVTAIQVKYRVWGAGGGGGGSLGSAYSSGGCGGGGGYAEGISTLTPGASITVTLGTPGVAGSGATVGGNATATTLAGALVITANGGSGGAAGTGTSAIAGGAGGSASGGQLNITGGSGWGGGTNGPGQAIEGLGGGSFGTTVSLGSNGYPGGGGTGAANQTTGTAGGSGLVIFEWMAP